MAGIVFAWLKMVVIGILIYYFLQIMKFLKEITENYCDDVKFINNPKEGYEYILSNTKEDETVLICGSFYLMSDIFAD